MLFEDEDVLFGGSAPDSPPVDLFAPGSPVSPTKVRYQHFVAGHYPSTFTKENL